MKLGNKFEYAFVCFDCRVILTKSFIFVTESFQILINEFRFQIRSASENLFVYFLQFFFKYSSREEIQ